jgi:hypothetical protein
MPTYSQIEGMAKPVLLDHGFINSISLVQDESSVVYGRVEDTEFDSNPTLERGQAWTLSFYDSIFIGETAFSVSSYSLTTTQNKYQDYYFIVPRNNYNSDIYLRIPGIEDEDDYSVEVTINEQDRVKAAETLFYPEKTE